MYIVVYRCAMYPLSLIYFPPPLLASPHPHALPFRHLLYSLCANSLLFFSILSIPLPLQPFLLPTIPLLATRVLPAARFTPPFHTHLLLRNDGREQEKMWRKKGEKRRERERENVWDQHSSVSILPPSLPASLHSSSAASPYPINSQLLISLLYSPAFFYRTKYHQ